MQNKLAILRSRGWRVAVHNDYRLAGEDRTFWLFTHPNGWWIKGEGWTDDAALDECLAGAGQLACDCVDGHEPHCRAVM